MLFKNLRGSLTLNFTIGDQFSVPMHELNTHIFQIDHMDMVPWPSRYVAKWRAKSSIPVLLPFPAPMLGVSELWDPPAQREA